MTTISRQLMNRLPVAAKEKWRVLDQQNGEASALTTNCYQRLLDIRQRKTRLEYQREHIVSEKGSSEAQRLAATKEIDEEIASLADESLRLGASQELSKASGQRSSNLLRSMAEWLNALPPDLTLAEHPGGDRSNKHEVTPDAIEKRRRRIRELIADVRRTDAAPYPAAAAKQVAREEIEQLAERGRPTVYQTIEILQPIGWPDQVLDINTTMATAKARDGIALVAWLQRDALIAAVEKEIDDNADDGHALTDAQRSESFKTLFGDLLAAEREEEALIQAAHFNVDRRPDADPRAVLGLSSELPGPKRDLVHRRLIVTVDNLPATTAQQPPTSGNRIVAIPVQRTTPNSAPF